MTEFLPAGYEPVTITTDERTFFISLGARIARLRKDQGITQVQLAEDLDVSQQTVNSYEVGRRRIPVSMLPRIAKRLGVAAEELINDDSGAAARKRGPAPKLQQQMDRITKLPKSQQRFVMQVIESVLAQSTNR
jgi:transcriptional regulator with XRE-family HTH domain